MALPWGGQSHSSHLKWTSRYATSRWSWLYRWNLTWNESITTYKWPSSVLSDNLFGLTWKRERCRRLRLLYNGTDVPLAWKGAQPCFPLVPLTKRRRGVCLMELAKSASSVKPRKCTSLRDAPTVSREPHLTQAVRDSCSCPPCHWPLVLWTFLAPVVQDAWDGPARSTGPLVHSGDSCHMICIASLVSADGACCLWGLLLVCVLKRNKINLFIWAVCKNDFFLFVGMKICIHLL